MAGARPDRAGGSRDMDRVRTTTMCASPCSPWNRRFRGWPTSCSVALAMLHRAAVLAVSFLAGCAAAPPPPPEAPPEPVRAARGPSSMESEIGGMNEQAVERAFAELAEPMLACVASRSKRVKELGGHFLVSLRIDPEGKARWAYLSESTLGDREAEKCIADVARAAEWPKPVGGDGLASRSFDVDPTAAPVAWEVDRIERTMKFAEKNLWKCKKSPEGTFVATAYVRPSGHVATAGVVPPDATRGEEADCLADVIGKMRFGSPGRRAAKVTFDVP